MGKIKQIKKKKSDQKESSLDIMDILNAPYKDEYIDRYGSSWREPYSRAMREHRQRMALVRSGKSDKY